MRLTAKIHIKCLKIGKFVVEYKKQLVNTVVVPYLMRNCYRALQLSIASIDIFCCTLSNEELLLFIIEDIIDSIYVVPYLMRNCYHYKVLSTTILIKVVPYLMRNCYFKTETFTELYACSRHIVVPYLMRNCYISELSESSSDDSVVPYLMRNCYLSKSRTYF